MIMKYLVLLFVLIFGSDAALLVDESAYSFEDFVKDFHKSYPTQKDYAKRKAIFEKNLKTIVSHNSECGKPHHHVLGVNMFADHDAHELPRGYIKPRQARLHTINTSTTSTTIATTTTTSPLMAMTERRLEITELPFELSEVNELPASVDWRTKGKTTPVKNQGMCGSCWAFASTAVLESHIAIQTGTLFSFSEQEFVSCAPNPHQCGGSGGCAGSTAEIAFAWAARKGMVTEWEFGYQSYHGAAINCTLVDQSPGNIGSPSFLRNGAVVATQEESQHYKGAVAGIQGYYKLPTNNYKVLMNAVAKHGPVAVSVACYPWHLYQGGIFYHPLNTTRTTDIDHLVVLEGYGTDETTGKDYWLVRNSWSPLWGEAGYIRLLRVDPATLDDPETDCGMDTTPSDGVSCTKDDDGNDIVPPAAKVCGNSGILYDTAIPIGGYLL